MRNSLSIPAAAWDARPSDPRWALTDANFIDLYNTTPTVVTASGDVTGATDTAALNTALTAARLAGGGKIVGKAGSTYYLSNKLVIGSYTTLDMTGCKIILVRGSNCSMLQNYGMQAPVATGVVDLTAGSATAYVPDTGGYPGSADAVWNYISAWGSSWNSGSNYTRTYIPGLTIVVPMMYGTYSQLYVGTVINTYSGGGSFNLDTPAVATVTNGTCQLYQRDQLIRVIGGTWDRQDNASASSTDVSHNIMFRYADGIVVKETTEVSETPTDSTFLYGIFGQSVTAMTIRDVNYGANPDILLWSSTGSMNGQSGYGRDGIHIAGPAKHILIDGVTGSTGDNFIVLSCADLTAQSGNIVGPVSFCEIRGVHGYTTQCLVAIYSGYGVSMRDIDVHNVHGWADGSAGVVQVADYPNSPTYGGLYDNILIDGVYANSPSNGIPLIYLAGANMGRIKLKNLKFENSSSTAAGVINIGAVNNVATTIAELTIDDFVINGLGSSKVIYDNGYATITRLRTSNWSNPIANYPLVAITGAVGNWDNKDKIPLASLTGQTSAISATTAFVVPSGGAGIYRVVADIVVATAGTAGTVLGSVITNNGGANFTQSTSALSLTTAGNEVTQTFEAYCAAGTNINYSTTLSGVTGSPQYSVRLRAEFLG